MTDYIPGWTGRLPRPPWRPTPASSPVNAHASLSRESYVALRRLAQPDEVAAAFARIATWAGNVAVPEDLGEPGWLGGNDLARRVLVRLVTEDARRQGVLLPDMTVWSVESGRRDGARRGTWVCATMPREVHHEVTRRRGLLTFSEYAAHLILARAPGEPLSEGRST